MDLYGSEISIEGKMVQLRAIFDIFRFTWRDLPEISFSGIIVKFEKQLLDGLLVPVMS